MAYMIASHLYVAFLFHFTHKSSIIDDKWYVDIGAIQHMSHGNEAFINYEQWQTGPFDYFDDNSTH